MKIAEHMQRLPGMRLIELEHFVEEGIFEISQLWRCLPPLDVAHHDKDAPFAVLDPSFDLPLRVNSGLEAFSVDLKTQPAL
jgi:hypothetical protein